MAWGCHGSVLRPALSRVGCIMLIFLTARSGGALHVVQNDTTTHTVRLFGMHVGNHMAGFLRRCALGMGHGIADLCQAMAVLSS